MRVPRATVAQGLAVWLYILLGLIVQSHGALATTPDVSLRAVPLRSSGVVTEDSVVAFTEVDVSVETAMAHQETPGIPLKQDGFKDPNEVDPRTPDHSHPAFQKPYAPMNVDMEPIAGGVIRMDLKRLEADAACFCHLPDRIRKLEGSECLIPHRITIHKDATWQPNGVPEASPALLQRIVGSINEVRLVTSTHSSFACVDGRQVHIDQPRTFGGDMGEMIQILSFIERKRKRSFSSVEVAQFFEKWVSQSRGKGLHEQFYFSTDTTALMRLTQWLRDNFGLHGSQLIDLTNVPAFLARPVLNGLQQAVHHGNLPIRLMLEFPDKFKVVPSVAHKLFEAYFSMLWRRDKEFEGESLHNRLQFVVAEGLHQERVFLDVRNTAYCTRENIHSVLTISKLPAQTRAVPGYSPPIAKATTKPHYSHAGREAAIAETNVDAMLAHEAEATQRRTKNALPHAQTKSGYTKRIRRRAVFLETETQIASQKPQAVPDLITRLSADLEARHSGNVEEPALLAAKAEDQVTSIIHPETISEDARLAHEALRAEYEASRQSHAFDTAQSHALVEEPSNVTNHAQAEMQRIREQQTKDAKRDDEFMQSLVETLGYDHRRHPVDNRDARRHADANYPWASESGALIGDSRYRPQDGMQAFIFNSQAAESLRRELLMFALSTFKLGRFDPLWAEYSQLMTNNDGLFTQLIASGIPSYVVFMS